MTRLYSVDGNTLKSVVTSRLDKEDDLQRWIHEDPSLIGLDVLVLGREIETTSGRIDILALDRDANAVIIECKRGRTPRDVVAQILDYASWVNDLSELDLNQIAMRKRNEDLKALFEEKFHSPLPDKINASHSLYIVSSEFDLSSKRIVEYLAQVHRLAINAVFFTTFEHLGQTLLATNWLMDPEEVKERAESKVKIPWSGLWYVNVGDGEHRSWGDMRTYGFLAAGHGRIYSDALRRLKPGDQVLAYQSGRGYVGYGLVSSSALPVNDFVVNGKAILDYPLKQPNLGSDADNSDMSEYLVGVQWKKDLSLDQAKTFGGIFANQNVVCKLRDASTIQYLREQFSIEP